DARRADQDRRSLSQRPGREVQPAAPHRGRARGRRRIPRRGGLPAIQPLSSTEATPPNAPPGVARSANAPPSVARSVNAPPSIARPMIAMALAFTLLLLAAAG